MTTKRDELGEFLEAYELYLKGDLEYDALPVFGDVKLLPPCEARCFECNKPYARKTVLVRASKYGTVQAIPLHCPECKEIISSGPRQPLPVAKVVKR